MILSIALILFFGFLAGFIFEKIKLPKVVGMLIIGVLLGPSVLNWLDVKILDISAELRQIALVIILTRAGLSLDLKSLKSVGRPAILMCFVPASLEIIGTTIFAPMILGISYQEALLLGAVLGAVSPAVVVPMMIKLKDNNYGSKHAIPELLLAGSSCDDVFVIILFYSFLGLNQTGSFDAWSITKIPLSIILGIGLGIAVGFILALIIKKIKLNKVVGVIITLAISLFIVYLEPVLKPWVPFSALLGVMVYNIIIKFRAPEEAAELKDGYGAIWTVFEIILFVLVGAALQINLIPVAGPKVLLLLLCTLTFRCIGVIICLLFTPLTWKERLFAIIAYLPKATVQASIGGIALEAGLACGDIVLTVAVIAIVITAPVGAIGMNFTYKHLLEQNELENKASLE